MKDGDRGWITVKLLRELLIDVPGDYTLTPVGEKKLLIRDATRKQERGEIDCQTEKLSLKDVAVSA